jgi:hypothetical protein
MKRTPLLFLLVLVALKASAQDYSYDQHSRAVGTETFTERVTLQIIPVRTKILDERVTVLPVVGALAAPLINVGISAVKANLEKRLKQYRASYVCSNSGDSFYETRQYANLPELTIRRSITIRDRHSPTGEKTVDALNIVLEPQLSSDKHAFRYRVKNVNMVYSKARTRQRFDYIDVQLDVIFRSLATEATKQDIVTLRAFTLTIPSVKPNSAYDLSSMPESSWLPFPPPLQVTKGVGVYDKTGPYEFLINVTETNPYKVRTENKQVLIEKSGDALSELAAEIAEEVKKASGK